MSRKIVGKRDLYAILVYHLYVVCTCARLVGDVCIPLELVIVFRYPNSSSIVVLMLFLDLGIDNSAAFGISAISLVYLFRFLR